MLASCVESVWAARCASSEQPHLTAALWLWCGALGMRVWLPLFPIPPPSSTRHSSLPPPSHTFMSKRIMLPFHLKIYPLGNTNSHIFDVLISTCVLFHSFVGYKFIIQYSKLTSKYATEILKKKTYCHFKNVNTKNCFHL